MALEFIDVSKRYQDKVAVNRVNLSIDSGIWGLLGANGAGKTTLIRMAVGILKPSKGHIQYDGIDISTLGASYRDLIGYLPQSFGFYPEFTVKAYLEYMSSLKGLSKSAAKKKIEELLYRLQLEDVQNKHIRKLSGGVKRRVGMAQALLNDPGILILDEPTSGLDPGERIRLRQILAEFSRHRIVLISTHIVSDIESIANQNAIMKNGKIIALGATNELTKSVDGKVWQATCPTDQLGKYKKKVRIVNLYSNDTSTTTVRYVCNEAVIPDSTHMQPTLEDLYFWLFNEKERAEENGL